MKEHLPTGTLQCYWSNLKEHPKCIHGPTLLFGRENNDEITKFYACSACRDRKLCSFFLEVGKEPSNQMKQILEKERKKNVTYYNHQKMFITYNQLMSESPANRIYCYQCEKLFPISENYKHSGHEVKQNLSDYEMTHPSEFLKPLDNSKKEAQYLFSKKAVKDITDFLVSLNAKNVLCIGAPRIHEYITANLEEKMSSLLLDFDGRFHNFFGPLNYCWYNLFNHYFFHSESEVVFKEFLTQNKGKDMYIVCDPPFGGRVEPMSQTIKTISDLHKKLNKISNTEDELKIFFIFPYFMEAIMKEKSNPLNVEGGLKDLKMTDYKVEYDNHPLFVSKANNQEQGSQVRIFTNVPLNLIKLPETDGYKYCKRCQRWVAGENKHCKICRGCTSKDGRRYRHCKVCKRCVKPTWQHCRKCDRCSLPSHKCGQKPKIGNCFKCKEIGHTEKECPLNSLENSTVSLKVKTQKVKTKKKDVTTSDKKLFNKKISKKVVDKLSSIVKLNKKKEKILTISNSVKNPSDIKLAPEKRALGLKTSMNKKIKANDKKEKKKKSIIKVVKSQIENSDQAECKIKNKKLKKDKLKKNKKTL